MNYGDIKDTINKNAVNKLLNEHVNEASKLIKEFTNFVKHSADSSLTIQHTIFENLSTYNISDKSLAIKYIDDNLSLVNLFEQKNIKSDNKKLAERFNINKVEKSELNEAIQTLINETSYSPAKNKSINKKQKAYEYVTNHITRNIDIVSENNVFSTDTLSEAELKLVNQKVSTLINEKYQHFSKEEKNVLTTIFNNNVGDNEKSVIFENVKTETINSLKNISTNNSDETLINEAIDKINNMSYNRESLVDDVITLKNLV